MLYASDVCMLLEVALLMASNGDRVMSREPCVCMQSVCVCVWMMGKGADWCLSEFQFTMPNKRIEIPLIRSEIFSDSGIFLSPLTELKQQTEQAAIDMLIYFTQAREGESE